MMPKVLAVLPPKNEDKAKEAVVKLMQAAAAVGVALDPQGFTHSWLQDSTRVVVAYEGDAPVGFGIMACGRRFFDGDMSASVLVVEGSARKQVLEFMLDCARMLGAQKLFYEGNELGGEVSDMRVVQVE